jgi:hypothetical protein
VLSAIKSTTAGGISISHKLTKKQVVDCYAQQVVMKNNKFSFTFVLPVESITKIPLARVFCF